MEYVWYSIFDFSFNYTGNEPAIITHQDFDWAKDLQANYGIIKQELNDYLIKHELKSYFNASMVSRQNSWRTISLKTWNIELYKNQNDFPLTNALIKKYPQIISASFNLLEPHSTILPHCGDTNAIYRCHLGLDIPEGLPHCGFRVKEDVREWKNGEWLVFMDAYNHEAWNHTSKDRYIFLIDVMRDEFYSQKNKISATVLTSLFIQKWSGKLNINLIKHPLMVKVIANVCIPFARLSVLMVNRLKWF